MKKTTLVAPFDEPLARAVAGETRLTGRSVAALLPQSKKADSPSPDAPAERPIPWNPSSYVSARSAVMETIVRFGGLDEAVFIASPGPAPDIAGKAVDIERLVQERVLGTLWLVREILSKLSSQGSGRFIFVLAHRDQGIHSPVMAAAFGALEAFALSLVETTVDSPYEIWTLQNTCPQDDITAQYIRRILDSSSDRRGSRVIKFSGKTGIFNRV